MHLFGYKAEQLKKTVAPLADRMRPKSLDEFAGQEDVVGKGTVLRQMLESGQVPSMMLWGPPGTGKTTLARLVAVHGQARFVQLSAVTSGVVDLRATVNEAGENFRLHAMRTVVFVDEIHRWNKSQQDAMLPSVEDGTIILIGATTENPSFALNSALLSRCRVFVLQKLSTDAVVSVLSRAVADTERGFGNMALQIEKGVLELIAEMADGDARVGLNALELSVQTAGHGTFSRQENAILLETKSVAELVKRSHLLYDKRGEEHYNIISALHKSMRGSDENAALYWLGRMLESGEDPMYVARRLVRFASEDIGLADPQALVQAMSAMDAVKHIGMPECNVCLAQVVVYMSRAPKSNALYVAYGVVAQEIAQHPNDPVPLHIRNAPTTLMKQLGYGKGYVYPPSAEGEVVQDYLPERLRGKKWMK